MRKGERKCRRRIFVAVLVGRYTLGQFTAKDNISTISLPPSQVTSASCSKIHNSKDHYFQNAICSDLERRCHVKCLGCKVSYCGISPEGYS